MSSSVEVIQEGYSRWHHKPNTMYANGSSTLVRANGMTVVVDTLSACDAKPLAERLTALNVLAEDVHLVVCTHSHPDHIGNLNLFPNCRHIVGDHVYERDLYFLNTFQSNDCIQISKDLKVIKTRGHTLSDVTLIVNNVHKLGTVAITGDLFECREDIDDPNIWKDAGSEDPVLQHQNRLHVLSMCDHIVPGHGPMFRVNQV